VLFGIAGVSVLIFAALLRENWTLKLKLSENKREGLQLENSLAAARLQLSERSEQIKASLERERRLREEAEKPVLDDIGVRVVTRWMQRPAENCSVLPTDAERSAAAVGGIQDPRIRAEAERLRTEVAQLRTALAELDRQYAEAIAHDLKLGAEALRLLDMCREYGLQIQRGGS
jgi:hypothetical protein